MINSFITIYDNLKTIVSQFFKTLKWKEREHSVGRKPTLTNSEIVACVIFKQRQNIATKKALYEILEPRGSYNRFVAALNRTAKYLSRIITAVINFLRKEACPIKFTDSTDIPVCLNKNARYHKTMAPLSNWSKTG